MTPQELRLRTVQFARDALTLTAPLLSRRDAEDSVRQLRRAAASVAANYRATGRARSHREFTSKLSVVLEEADESLHWLEFVRDCALASGPDLQRLIAEAKQLVAIFAASVRTARRRESHERRR